MTPALELRGVQKSFGNPSVIRDVNLTILKGERHALIGPNGAGKTTLFNLISGYMKPTAGRILLKDEIVSGLPPYQINRRGLSRSFQVTNVFPKMSVWENIRCALLWTSYRIARLGLGYVPENRDIFPGLTVRQNLMLGIKDTRRPAKWRLEDILQMFPNLAARADTAAGVLSSGEQQMLTICRTLMGDPELIMIDEPPKAWHRPLFSRSAT